MVTVVRKKNLDKTKTDFSNVTSKEYQCAKYLLEGYGLHEIASLMCISSRTLEKHIRSLRIKMGSKNNINLLYKLRIYFECNTDFIT